MQAFFFMGAGVWVHTTVLLVTERMTSGMPWIRMSLILTAVAVLTLASAWIVRRREMR